MNLITNSGEVRYESNCKNMKECLEQALEKGIDCTNLNLRCADLKDAYLQHANLQGADMQSANLRYSNLKHADLKYADLRYAIVHYANLQHANFEKCNILGANFYGANLSGVDLRQANTDVIKQDLFCVLDAAQHEVPYLLKAIKEGQIDGSVYNGSCCCLIGTLCKAGAEIENLKNVDRPIEEFVLKIRPGHTPKNNPISALLALWVEEFMKEKNIVNQL